jgi:hypothetical protein
MTEHPTYNVALHFLIDDFQTDLLIYRQVSWARVRELTSDDSDALASLWFQTDEDGKFDNEGSNRSLAMDFARNDPGYAQMFLNIHDEHNRILNRTI